MSDVTTRTSEVAGPDRIQADTWRVYAHLQERARIAQTLPELCFTVANETWQLFRYSQSFVWRIGSAKATLTTVSGLAQLSEDSPFTTWLRRLGHWLEDQLQASDNYDSIFLRLEDIPNDMQDGWTEWLPSYLFVQALVSPDGQLLGFAGFALDEAPSERIQEVSLRTMAAYGHAWALLAPPSARKKAARRYGPWFALMLLIAALFLPVRSSVLAPAQIVALDALAVAAPMDGVVRSFAVQPNQRVKSGQILFTLDDTTLRNRKEVAARQLQVARADALAAAQKAFASETSRANLASLNGLVAQREAELAYVADQLSRVEVRAAADGIIVFADANDWQGRPVATGERLALLAEPQAAGILVWLAVPDAINLELGAIVKLYLEVAPLSPVSGVLIETSYQAVASPLGVQSYRLRARFDPLSDEQRGQIRIGLKGTAKIFGEQVSLWYYLFRRPIASMRQMLGL